MTTTTATAAVQPGPAAQASLELLDRARHSLLEACQSQEVARRYDCRPSSGRCGRPRPSSPPARGDPRAASPGPRSLWELLPTVAPELSEWAGFFELVGQRGRRRRSQRPGGRRPRAPVRDLPRPGLPHPRPAGAHRQPRRGAGAHRAGGWGEPPVNAGEVSDAGFAHLHVASGFSMRYGTATPEALVERAAQHRQPILALTDRDGLYGAVRFVQAATAAGIAPVLGVDLAAVRRPDASPGGPAASRPGRGGPTVGRPPQLAPGRRSAGGAERDPATRGSPSSPGGGRPGSRRGGLGGVVPPGHPDPPARGARGCR